MRFKNPSKLAGVVVLAGAASAPALVTAQAVQVITIGHVGPMSGPQAHYGRDVLNGAQMAVDDVNAQNPVIAGKRVRFQIDAEDDAADPKQGATVAQKLCDAKVAGVIGHFNSGTAIPAARIYHDCGIAHITGSASNPELTKPGWSTTYRVIANDNALGAALANYAADTLHLKKVAVIDDRTAYGQGLANIFAKVAKERGLQVVDHEYTTDKATDFMAILTAIKSRAPEGVFYGGYAAQLGPMLRQMEQLGMGNIKSFGGDGICTSELVNLAGNSADVANTICAVGGASLAKQPGGTQWRQRYEAKYPGQFQVYSPYTYDATMVLIDAMKRANSWDPKVYIPFLQKADYQGVSAHIRFEPNGELKDPGYTLFSYKNGVRTEIN
jgi:branched-chain amino acid transport system substrate-binding protein